MTDTHYDRAAGDTSTLSQARGWVPSGVLLYTVGLLLAVILTATSFWAANTSLLMGPRRSARTCRSGHRADRRSLGLLPAHHHRTDNTNNVLALAFGMLIVILVIGGSLWIMTNLNANMMPSADLMNLQMQR